MTNAEEILGRVQIFADLKPKDLRKLAKDAHEVTFAAGTHLTDDDKFGTTFFVVVEGSVEVTVKGAAVRKLGVGSYFGEMALIDRETRSATVIAETDVRCLTFSRPAFRPFAYAHPEVAWALLEAMVARVREAEQAHADVGST
jgi:CRP-like cAMP-binding protein